MFSDTSTFSDAKIEEHIAELRSKCHGKMSDFHSLRIRARKEGGGFTTDLGLGNQRVDGWNDAVREIKAWFRNSELRSSGYAGVCIELMDKSGKVVVAGKKKTYRGEPGVISDLSGDDVSTLEKMVRVMADNEKNGSISLIDSSSGFDGMSRDELIGALTVLRGANAQARVVTPQEALVQIEDRRNEAKAQDLLVRMCEGMMGLLEKKLDTDKDLMTAKFEAEKALAVKQAEIEAGGGKEIVEIGDKVLELVKLKQEQKNGGNKKIDLNAMSVEQLEELLQAVSNVHDRKTAQAENADANDDDKDEFE